MKLFVMRVEQLQLVYVEEGFTIAGHVRPTGRELDSHVLGVKY